MSKYEWIKIYTPSAVNIITILIAAWAFFGQISKQTERIDHLYELILTEQHEFHEEMQNLNQRMDQRFQQVDQRFQQVDQKFYDLLKEAKGK